MMTILRSQRSDSGTYELRVSPDVLNQAPITDAVKISVKCKYNDFPYFLWETSTIIISDNRTYESTVSADHVNLAPIQDEIKILVKYKWKWI